LARWSNHGIHPSVYAAPGQAQSLLIKRYYGN
jgi:hypothetical protein